MHYYCKKKKFLVINTQDKQNTIPACITQTPFRFPVRQLCVGGCEARKLTKNVLIVVQVQLGSVYINKSNLKEKQSWHS